MQPSSKSANTGNSPAAISAAHLLNMNNSSNNRGMLKVIGASWEKTRATTYILTAFSFCGLLIIIFGGSATLSELDGNYAASVYWQEGPGFRIEFLGQGNVLTEIPMGVARGYYRQDIANIGWSKIEIETDPNYSDWVQAYSAGLLEGSLTWQLVHWRWKNTIESACDVDINACENIRTELNTWETVMRRLYMEQEITKLDPVLHHVRLFFAQLDGLISGWNYAVRRQRLKHVEIENVDFLWLNLLATDVPLPDSADLIPNAPTQTTAAPYRDMLRLVKRYVFGYHMTNNGDSSVVPGTALTFTGFPGSISSQDDFYTVSSKQINKHSMLVIGSTIGNDLPEFKDFSINKIPGTLRGLIASRLARDSRTWAAYYNRGHGGISVSKQWTVIDISKINTNDSNLIWVIENAKNKIMATDVSNIFREQTYWATYGTPYHQEIELTLNNYSDIFSLANTIRGDVFKICEKNCSTKKDIYQLIRNGIPVSEDFIGARADLYKNNPVPFGIIDTKLVTGTQELHLEMTAGPVHSENTTVAETPEDGFEPPFQWSTSSWYTVTHEGQPDIWSFASYPVIWAGY